MMNELVSPPESSTLEYYQRLLRQQPHNADIYYNLGVLLARQDRLAPAAEYFRQAVALRPGHAAALNNLGVILERQGDLDQAITVWQQALQIQPDLDAVYNNLGVALTQRGQLAEAIAVFQQAIRVNPTNVEATYNLANKWRDQGQLTEAVAGYRRALALNPRYLAAQNNLGLVLLQQGHLIQAEASFQAVLAADPADAEAHYNLGVTLGRQDQLEAARCHFQQAIDRQPDNLVWSLERDMLCPAVMASPAAIAAWRQQATTKLDHYRPGSFDLSHHLPALLRTNSQPPFYLHYQDLDNLAFKTRYAQLFTVSSPTTVQSPRASARDSYRLGFMVTVRNENLFLKLMGGVLNQLHRPEWRLTVICWPASVARLAPYLNNPRVDFLTLSPQPDQAIQQIKTAGFDLIYFFEVGSNAVNYFFPFFRLAPVQCTSWGLTDTSGLPQLDYYLSSRLFEPARAQQHYSERLVQFKSLLSYFYRPNPPPGLKNRADFNLPEKAALYFCPQNRLKFHPAFDELLAAILQRDPAGRLVLVTRQSQQWLEQRWLRRFQTHYPDLLPRIIMRPEQSYSDYLHLTALADVVLDTPHFNGGLTTIDGLALGAPIVTLPTTFMRGRMTLGCYQAMAMLDLVAESPVDYVNLAIRLGTDPAYRAEIRAKILAANGVLFENPAVVQQYEQFFQRALALARAANRPDDLGDTEVISQ